MLPTGATRSNFAAVTLHGTEQMHTGAVVADGTYNIERIVWNHGTARYCYVYFKFYKGPTSSTVTPTATNYIKGVTIASNLPVALAPVASMSNIIYKMCFYTNSIY